MVVTASAFLITQIGEESRKLIEIGELKNSSLPLVKIRGLRNVIVHEYSSINLEIIWDIVAIELPKLKKDIEKILKN